MHLKKLEVTTLEDKEIVSLYINRDESAIAQTEIKYGNYCRTIANNIVFNIQDSEECVNDTYLKVWNAIPPQIPNIFQAYLGRITRNLAITKYRYMSKTKRGGDKTTLVFDELDECIPSHTTVEKEYEAGLAAKAISTYLRTINAESRIIFIRRYWYAESISELANDFSMSESKVKSLLFRLRKKLKEYLEMEGIVL